MALEDAYSSCNRRNSSSLLPFSGINLEMKTSHSDSSIMMTQLL